MGLVDTQLAPFFNKPTTRKAIMAKRENREGEAIDHVVSQMMLHGTNTPSRKITKRQRENFKARHLKHIEWALKNLAQNKNSHRSVAVPAVIVKCLIKYNQQDVARFCNALRKGFFNGETDPAFLLWRFLQKHRGKNTLGVYQRTVCAAKAYLEGRQLKGLSEVSTDVFNWDEGWTVPDELLSNWKPDEVPEPVEIESITSVSEQVKTLELVSIE